MYKQAAFSVGLTLALVAMFFFGTQLSSIGTAQEPSSNRDYQRTISITGEALITERPDALSANISVVSLEAALADALADNSSKMTAVIEALKALGIEEKDIQTTGFSVYVQRAPKDKENPNVIPPIIGYHVANSITVTIRDLESAGDALDQAIQAGANSVDGIHFVLSNLDELREQAKVDAVADAMAKAQEMVAAAGAGLGPVLTIGSGSYRSPAEYDYSRNWAMEAANFTMSVPIEGGELEYRVSVQVTFAIN